MTASAVQTSAGHGLLSMPGEGPHYLTLGIENRIKADHQETGGAIDVFEQVYSPGTGILPHLHRGYAEAFYVLDGEVQCQVGERTVSAFAGTFGYAPRGVAHGYQNTSAAPATVLVWQFPASNVRGLLTEVGELPPGQPDLEALAPILKKYDLEPVGPLPTKS
jgi:quercetin dioxygenase-like cupin family protein